MVRLRLPPAPGATGGDLRFNPTMVRLRPPALKEAGQHLYSFNPTMVRLRLELTSDPHFPALYEFQSHYGAIATSETQLRRISQV